jgi:DNA-binding NarL/FixJ family response regulator
LTHEGFAALIGRERVEDTMPKLTAVVVDSDAPWLQAVAVALAESSVEVVATTTSLRDASRLVEQLKPGLVVVDVSIRDADLTGLTWLKEVSRGARALQIIALSRSDEADQIEAAFAGGASAYVVKRANPGDVAAAARQLTERSFYLAANVRPAEPAADGRELGLTRREVEILRLAAEGLTNLQIAGRVWVTVQTVKFHLANTYRKLGVSNRTEASRRAQDHGLL